MYEHLLLLGTIIAVIAGGLIYYKNKKACINKLKKCGAVSPQTAVKPEQAGISWGEKVTLEITLVQLLGLVRKTEDERYYIPNK